MRKPTYYLWRTDFLTETEFDTAKEKYQKLGFRVVTYLEGTSNNDIHNGLKALIKNHIIK